MDSQNDVSLRDHLVTLLDGGNAYDRFEEIVEGFSAESHGIMPAGPEHSAWQILWHMSVSLRDILDYSQNDDGDYVEKEWPEGYWPKETAPPTETAWEEMVASYLADRSELQALARSGNLFRPFPWAPEHTLLRQILLAADHSAYHCGQLVLVQEMVQNP